LKMSITSSLHSAGVAYMSLFSFSLTVLRSMGWVMIWK